MGLSMAERNAVTKALAARYRVGSRATKTEVLDQLCELTGWSRRHARRALTAGPRPKRTRQAPVIYDEEVRVALRQVWAVLGGPCGKRMAPFLAEMVAVLEHHGELRVSDEVRHKLSVISAATIDRLLAGERASMTLKGRSGTKPGSLLRSQIPIRTFADWDEARPGFFEVDLVGHDGGVVAGSYAQTVMFTDVYSGWCEPRVVANKAQKWVHEAIAQVCDDVPFPVVGLDSDNGSEFINQHLMVFCEAREITFTRTRPYRKNDNCFVEQKNWSVVRHAVGYARYDTEPELEVLKELYGYLAPMVNFFRPQQKLVSKTRNGAKVTRRHDSARTPYQRLMDSPDLDDRAKQNLAARYVSLNPAELARGIDRCQQALLDIATHKSNERRWIPGSDHPWRRTPQPRQRIAAPRTT